MKYNLVVTEITHDELVSIFSMLCTSNDFSVSYRKKDYNQIPKEKRHGECYEEKIADCLLNGFPIMVTDIQADEECYNENLERHVDEEDGSVSYFVKLDDFLKGFSNPEAMDCVKELAEENDDYWTAYNLIQYVIFGELIYG